jgi:hypothetical protein
MVKDVREEVPEGPYVPIVRVDDIRSSEVLMEKISRLVETLGESVRFVVLENVLNDEYCPDGSQEIEVDPVMSDLRCAVGESCYPELDAVLCDVWFQLANVGLIVGQMRGEKFSDAVETFLDVTEGENSSEPIRGFYIHFANRCEGGSFSDMGPILNSLRTHKTKVGSVFFNMILNYIRGMTFEDLKVVIRLVVDIDCDVDSDANFVKHLTHLPCTRGRGDELRMFFEGLLMGKENGFGGVTLDRIKWAFVEGRF